MNKGIKKKIRKTALGVVERELEAVYSSLYIPEIIDVLETSYDFLSGSVVFHRQSKLNLMRFKSLFMERVNEHEFLNLERTFSGYAIELDIPSVDSFDFSSGLEILELITLGVPGDYIEVDERMRRKISHTFPKAPLSFRVDNTIVYLYDTKRYSSLLNTLREKDMDIMMFPFSVKKNKGFDVFEAADDYDDDNFDSMLELVHTNITKELKTELRR